MERETTLSEPLKFRSFCCKLFKYLFLLMLCSSNNDACRRFRTYFKVYFYVNGKVKRRTCAFEINSSPEHECIAIRNVCVVAVDLAVLWNYFLEIASIAGRSAVF
jgi:hypothetical protein